MSGILSELAAFAGGHRAGAARMSQDLGAFSAAVIATNDPPQDVIVTRLPDGLKPWYWRSRDVQDPADPRFRGRYQFPDCEAAWDDAVERGHRPAVKE